MNKFFELVTFFQKKGFIETVRRIQLRYFSITRFVLYKGDLSEEYNGIQLEPDYDVVVDDFELLNEIRSNRNDLPREFYIDITHGGKKFYLVSLKNDPSYIVWIVGKEEFSRFFSFKDNLTVEFAYGYTTPAFRGQKLYSKTINYACQDLKNKGYKTVVGAISDGNINCHHAIKHTPLKQYMTVKSYFSFNKKIQV